MSSDRYLHNVYVQGDRIVLAVIWLMCLNSLALANWYDSWQTALFVSVPLALLSTAAVIFCHWIVAGAANQRDGLHVSGGGHPSGTRDDRAALRNLLPAGFSFVIATGNPWSWAVWSWRFTTCFSTSCYAAACPFT